MAESSKRGREDGGEDGNGDVKKGKHSNSDSITIGRKDAEEKIKECKKKR